MLEFRQEALILRVDGDVLEIFRRGVFSERVPLAWLAVQVLPASKGSLIVRIGSAHDDAPLYEIMQKANTARRNAVEVIIRTDEEPLYQQFFAQVAQTCGRSVLT